MSGEWLVIRFGTIIDYCHFQYQLSHHLEKNIILRPFSNAEQGLWPAFLLSQWRLSCCSGSNKVLSDLWAGLFVEWCWLCTAPPAWDLIRWLPFREGYTPSFSEMLSNINFWRRWGLNPYVLDGEPGLIVVICQLITSEKKTYLSPSPTINVF